MKEKIKGKLIIKEYPTASAGCNHFRFLLNELKLKKKFVPDVIYVDYLNICISSRLKYGQNIGSYGYVKSIAEEFRGLAQEYNLPIITATQLNREGAKNSDADMEHTSESWGLPHTVDFMFSIYQNETLFSLNQFKIKQLKNRYRDENTNRSFVIGVDKSKMRLYDCEQSAQDLTENVTTVPEKPKYDFNSMLKGDKFGDFK